MREVKYYIQPSTPDVSKSGSQLFMIGAWLVLGMLIFVFFPDSFFLVSYVLISLAWAGFMWWYVRDQQRPQFFIALSSDGLTIKTSPVSDLRFKWSDVSSIQLKRSQMTIAVKNHDEYDVGLEWLSSTEFAEWTSSLENAAVAHNIRLSVT